MRGKRCPEAFKAETVKQVIDRGYAGKISPNKKALASFDAKALIVGSFDWIRTSGPMINNYEY